MYLENCTKYALLNDNLLFFDKVINVQSFLDTQQEYISVDMIYNMNVVYRKLYS